MSWVLADLMAELYVCFSQLEKETVVLLLSDSISVSGLLGIDVCSTLAKKETRKSQITDSLGQGSLS